MVAPERPSNHDGFDDDGIIKGHLDPYATAASPLQSQPSAVHNSKLVVTWRFAFLLGIFFSAYVLLGVVDDELSRVKIRGVKMRNSSVASLSKMLVSGVMVSLFGLVVLVSRRAAVARRYHELNRASLLSQLALNAALFVCAMLLEGTVERSIKPHQVHLLRWPALMISTLVVRGTYPKLRDLLLFCMVGLGLYLFLFEGSAPLPGLGSKIGKRFWFATPSLVVAEATMYSQLEVTLQPGGLKVFDVIFAQGTLCAIAGMVVPALTHEWKSVLAVVNHPSALEWLVAYASAFVAFTGASLCVIQSWSAFGVWKLRMFIFVAIVAHQVSSGWGHLKQAHLDGLVLISLGTFASTFWDDVGDGVRNGVLTAVRCITSKLPFASHATSAVAVRMNPLSSQYAKKRSDDEVVPDDEEGAHMA